MRVQVRIVAGELRGRKLTCEINPGLRPTPQRVRESLFSILGDAVPDRPFYDIFAGTGVVGLEALSRGASITEFIERDFRLAQEIERHLETFGYEDEGMVRRADAYRWAEHWAAPEEPVNAFVSPPFSDLDKRTDDLLALVSAVQKKVQPGSVLVVQSERGSALEQLPQAEQWEERRYGRNVLWIWVREPDGDGQPEGNGQSE